VTPEENRKRIAKLHADEGLRDGGLGHQYQEKGFLSGDDMRYMLAQEKERVAKGALSNRRATTRRWPSETARKVA
jgi:hypothetical protein